MHFGIHTGLWMQRWTDDPSVLFDKIARMGFDGAELSLLGITLKSAEHIRKNAESYGLSITCSTGLGVGQDPSSADADKRQCGLDALARAVEITAALGATCLAGVVASPWGVFDPQNMPSRMQYAADSLGSLQPHLRAYNVRLAIEALNRFESDIACGAQHALHIARISGADNVGVLLDTFHMNIEEKHPAQMIRSIGDKLFHYHISAHDRGVPTHGRYDFNKDAAALCDIGYDGWVVAEMFVQPGHPTSDDLHIWYPIETDTDTAANTALKFIQQVYGQ